MYNINIKGYQGILTWLVPQQFQPLNDTLLHNINIKGYQATLTWLAPEQLQPQAHVAIVFDIKYADVSSNDRWLKKVWPNLHLIDVSFQHLFKKAKLLKF